MVHAALVTFTSWCKASFLFRWERQGVSWLVALWSIALLRNEFVGTLAVWFHFQNWRSRISFWLPAYCLYFHILRIANVVCRASQCKVMWRVPTALTFHVLLVQLSHFTLFILFAPSMMFEVLPTWRVWSFEGGSSSFPPAWECWFSNFWLKELFSLSWVQTGGFFSLFPMGSRKGSRRSLNYFGSQQKTRLILPEGIGIPKNVCHLSIRFAFLKSSSSIKKCCIPQRLVIVQ